jgi:hypothetical protein
MAFKVFISYSWSNSAERAALVSEISKIPSASVLVDKASIGPGDPIHQTISKMLDAADGVIVLLTQEGLRSREVLDEISRAHERGKFIIPIVKEGMRLESLPWYLRDLNFIPYNGRNFDAVAESIVGAVRRLADPLRSIGSESLPESIRAKITEGAQFVDVLAQYPHQDEGEDIFCVLSMRHSDATIVFRASSNSPLEKVAAFLANYLLPHLRESDYEWGFSRVESSQKGLPGHLTFRLAGICSGDGLYLVGNHRMPQWMPSPASPRGFR